MMSPPDKGIVAMVLLTAMITACRDAQSPRSPAETVTVLATGNFQGPTPTENESVAVPTVQGTGLPSPTSQGLAICSPSPEAPKFSTLAFVASWSGTMQVYTIGQTGGQPSRVSINDVSASSPQWSPDGATLATIVQTSAGSYGLKLLDSATKSESMIVAPPRQIGNVLLDSSGQPVLDLPGDQINADMVWFAWSHDSSRLSAVMVTDPDIRSDLYVIDKSGNEQARLTPDFVTVGNHQSWAPDDSLIAFDGSVASNPIFQRVMLRAPDGGGFQTIESGAMRQMAPEWDPTGASLVFVAQDAPDSDYYLSSYTIGTKTFGRVATSLGNVVNAEYSPDGRSIAFGWVIQGDSGQVVSRGISIVGQGQEEARIGGKDTEVDPPFFAWAPDGRTIAYLRLDSDRPDIYLLDICEQSSRLLVKDVDEAFFTWRPKVQ